MRYDERLDTFRQVAAGSADLVYFPISADLQYLTGVTRDIPTYGAIVYPGAWVEGLWIPGDADPVLVLTRMRADFHAPDTAGLAVRVLGDVDDPVSMLRSVLHGTSLPGRPRVAVGRTTNAETLIQLQGMFPGAKYLSSSELLKPQRMVKTGEEVSLMQRAGEITEAAFGAVLPKLRHGMSELDIISEIDFQLRRYGSSGSSFNTALYCVGPGHELVFGQHGESWHRPLNPPVSILFDFGAIHEGYCYDYGRTVVFGEADETAHEVHALVMRSQAAGIAAMRAGNMTAAEVDAAARGVIEASGYGDAFRHRLGHGIGLDVHEPPFLTASDDTALELGMCFTVEPSILIEGELSARVEDIVFVGEDGGAPLTSGYQELIVIE